MDTADELAFRNSETHGGALVGVARKDEMDVCWCCHAPLHSYMDVSMGKTFIRLCRRQSCIRAAQREKETTPRVTVLESISEWGKKLIGIP